MISICIPSYEAGGFGIDFITRLFASIALQSYKDFEVIVSDHSFDAKISNFCYNKFPFTVKYYYNPRNRGSSSANINKAMSFAKGDIIKVMFQDDCFANEDALAMIAKQHDGPEWMVSASVNSDGAVIFPECNGKPDPARNTIGCPSVLSIKNDGHLLFDENLLWLMDCEYYRRCYDTFGSPRIIRDASIAIGTGDYQVTNQIGLLRRVAEELYVMRKHKTWKD